MFQHIKDCEKKTSPSEVPVKKFIPKFIENLVFKQFETKISFPSLPEKAVVKFGTSIDKNRNCSKNYLVY